MSERTNTPIRLVLAYDGSDVAADAIRAAGRLFPGADALVIYHRDELDASAHASLARIAMPDAVTIEAVREYERSAAAHASELAERGRESARRAGLRASSEVRSSGSAWRGVANAADDEAADVIVCGSRGRGPLARAWLGSTSSSLVHHAERPVLVVPPGAGDLDGPSLIGYDGSEGARAAIVAAARLLPGRPALVVHAWSSADPAFLRWIGAARRPGRGRARHRDGHRRDPRRRKPRGRPRTAPSSPGGRASRRTAAPSSPAPARGGRWPPSAGRRAPR